MFLQPIPNQPALFIPDLKMLVIADLHIGIENELRTYGVQTASHISTLLRNIVSLINKFKPETIIILGDVKHTIPATPFHEKNELYHFLETLHKRADVIIIPGNHDGNITSMIPDDIIVTPSDGFINNRIGFIHGHRWPRKELLNCEYLFCGHTHPTIKFTDKMGFHSYEPCWIKGPPNKTQITEKYQQINQSLVILIFPAFNPLCGGIAINEEDIIGPMQQIIDLPESSYYLLDGSLLKNIL